LSEKVQPKNSAIMPQKKNNSRQTKVSAERNGDKSQNAYFLSLELENVRCRILPKIRLNMQECLEQ